VSNCDAVFDTVGGDVAQRSFAVLKQGRPRRLHCLGRAGAAARTRRRRVAYNASFIF
jgi:NADPH:quinone reductase-like Zn-dependent oxidoreductase